ncbi:hypothetical protein B0H66DRAFT_642375 [Apodospora peruviana]|uniref:protein-ribulosamine 3-kinase n=1 Tax=Apodospora peruviana TaxID=516989 RepID=A0AAE0M186_9PEZI|nr:hypothetical protein B0H66DRAFT_642375 [Apodospora peruviana]
MPGVGQVAHPVAIASQIIEKSEGCFLWASLICSELRQVTSEREIDMVIPRLLRPLETEGRTLIRTLVHGDLWDGNASVDVSTGRPLIFDPTPLYAHNEYGMGPWWAPRHKMTSAYIAAYTEHYQKSEPVADFEDCGAPYGLRVDLHASSLYPGSLRHRNLVMDTMRALLKKYPLGYTGYLVEKNSAAAASNQAVTASWREPTTA